MSRDPLQNLAFRYLRHLTTDPVTGARGFGTRYNTPKLRRNLLQADIALRPEEFVAAALLTGIIGSIIGLGFTGFMALEYALGNISNGYMVVLAILSIYIFWVVGLRSYLAIPASIAARRARDIDYKLPYALNFIAAMSSANVTPITVFKGLAKQPVYGEVQNEATRIVRDVEVLGMDLVSTLHAAIQRSPSLKFQEFLQGITTTTTTGGELKPYFVEKAADLVRENRSDQKRFIDSLSLLAESYVTIVVAAPLFIIIVLSVLMLISTGGSFSRKAELMAYVIVFIIIPVVQFAYTYLIRTRSPEPPDSPLSGKITTTFREVGLALKYPRHTGLLTQEQKENLNRQRALLATVIFSLIFLAGTVIALNWNNLLGLRAQDFFILTVLSLMAPYALYEWSTLRRIHNIELTIADFLRDLAESTRAGMTLHAAIRKASHGSYGELTDEIITMALQISWGVSAIDALKLFSERVRTPLIARSVALITEASLAGGNVADVLKSAADNTKEIQLISRERQSAMSIYTSVIYMSFFILMGVLMAIYAMFLPTAVEATTSAAPLGQTSFLPEQIDVGFFQLIFAGAILIQGFGGGMVAGVISRGKVMAGFRYSFLMVLIGYLIPQIVFSMVSL